MKRPQSANYNRTQEAIYAPAKKLEKKDILIRPNSSLMPGNSSAISINVKKSPIFPKNFYNDQEELYSQILALKRQVNSLIQENRQLKTIQTQQMRYINKVDNVDQVLVHSTSVLGLKQQLGEGSIVPTLKAKIREQNDELDTLKDELQTQYKSVRLTQMKELEQQLKKYKDEVIRLSFLLKNALKINDTDLDNDKDIQDRIMKQIEVIATYKQENADLKMKVSQNSADIQSTKVCSHIDLNEQVELQKSQTLVTQLALERAHLRKTLDEFLAQSSQLSVAKKRDMFELKLEQYIRESDLLKGELAVKENKMTETLRQYRELQKEYKATSMSNQRTILDLQELSEKKERVIQELQDRVYILDLMKQKFQPPKSTENPASPKAQLVPPQTFSDVSIQFPEVIVDDSRFHNVKPVEYMQIRLITKRLRMQFSQLGMRRDEPAQFFGNTKYIKLQNLIEILGRFPFYLGSGEAQNLARVLVENDMGKGSYMEPDAVQELNVIQHRFIDIVPQYELRSLYRQHQLFMKVSYSWKQNYDMIESYIERQFNLKKLLISNLGRETAYDDVESLLYNLLFPQEQIDFVLQKNFDQTNSVTVADLKKLSKYFVGDTSIMGVLQFLQLSGSMKFLPTSTVPLYAVFIINHIILDVNALVQQTRMLQQSQERLDFKNIVENQKVISYSVLLVLIQQPQDSPKKAQESSIITDQSKQQQEEGYDLSKLQVIGEVPERPFPKVRVIESPGLGLSNLSPNGSSNQRLSVKSKEFPMDIKDADSRNLESDFQQQMFGIGNVLRVIVKANQSSMLQTQDQQARSQDCESQEVSYERGELDVPREEEERFEEEIVEEEEQVDEEQVDDQQVDDKQVQQQEVKDEPNGIQNKSDSQPVDTPLLVVVEPVTEEKQQPQEYPQIVEPRAYDSQGQGSQEQPNDRAEEQLIVSNRWNTDELKEVKREPVVVEEL